jgi:hypothetical protein
MTRAAVHPAGSSSPLVTSENDTIAFSSSEPSFAAQVCRLSQPVMSSSSGYSTVTPLAITHAGLDSVILSLNTDGFDRDQN